MNKLARQFRQLLPWFLMLEAVSYLGYYWPTVNSLGFILCLLAAIYFASTKYDYLIAFLLAELIIGSKGHLFALAVGGFDLSVRMMLWAVAILAWFTIALFAVARSADRKSTFKEFFWPADIKVFLPLLAISGLALVIGFANDNGWHNIYADANAWLYFLLIWPLSYAIKDISKDKLAFYGGVVAVAIGWLLIKTWVILYFFSHEFLIIADFYKWVRDSGVGEITEMKGSFYRIFIQSHVYPLVALAVAWYYLARDIFVTDHFRSLLNRQSFVRLVLVSSALLSVILIGLSRSFWVGLLSALLAIGAIFLFDSKELIAKKLKKFFFLAGTLSFTLVIALFIILVIIKIPFPQNTLEFNAASVLTERATETNESAIGSRWAMLPVLGEEISKSVIFGSGFGKTVTYKSEDPRVVAATGGIYTTFALEWGWLDMLLKFGLFGVLAYLYLLYKLWVGARQTLYIWPIRLALVALFSLHIFTPYLNHPLGIGIVLIVAFLEVGCHQEAAPRTTSLKLRGISSAFEV